MRKQSRAQMDLFLPLSRPSDMSGAERQKAVALLRVLLTEAVATANEPQANGKKGAGNE